MLLLLSFLKACYFLKVPFPLQPSEVEPIHSPIAPCPIRLANKVGLLFTPLCACVKSPVPLNRSCHFLAFLPFQTVSRLCPFWTFFYHSRLSLVTEPVAPNSWSSIISQVLLSPWIILPLQTWHRTKILTF